MWLESIRVLSYLITLIFNLHSERSFFRELHLFKSLIHSDRFFTISLFYDLTSTKDLYGNPQRNEPIDQDVQWESYLYNFALSSKPSLSQKQRFSSLIAYSRLPATTSVSDGLYLIYKVPVLLSVSIRHNLKMMSNQFSKDHRRLNPLLKLVFGIGAHKVIQEP